MDIQWKGAMDATLQATENTLRRLRDRQARYSAAKQRASEAYPSAFTTESATRLNVRRYDDAVEMMPPPLPAATASALTHRPSGCGGAHLHAAQLANVVAELQLERNTRIDEVRELQRRLTNEAAELRHAIAQGREEHTFLRRSVTALEEQAAFDVPQPREAAANATRLGAAKRAWMENSAMSAYSDHMNSGLYSSIRPPTMASNADGGDAMLLRRVVELEERVRHQQGLLDDWQRRMDQSMAEIIRGQVQVEMERMRSVAREAARESAEELVKLRLTSMKEAMAADLRAMMDSSGLTNTLQRSAETYLRDVEQTWSRRMREMEMSHPRMQPLMQQGIHVREGDVNHKKLLDELELMRSHMGKMEKQMQEMDQREVSLRTAVEVVKSDLQTCVEMKTETVRQPTTSAPLEASDVHRMLDASSLHAGLEELRGRQDRQRSANDEWQRSLQERLSLLEKNHITAENERQPLRMSVEECVARMGTLAAQADALRDQVARCAGLVSDCQENVKEVVERTNRITATKEDETSTMERQHRELQRSMAAVDASVAALRKEHTATAERLCVVESNLASDRATVLPATREATAKVEALRLAVHERCLPQVESLGQRMTSVEERAREATSSTAHHEASAARINTDLRHEMLDQVKEVEARLRKLVEQVQSDDVAQYESFVSRITHAEQDIARCMARVAASAAAPIDTGKEGGNDSSAAPPTASGCTVEVVEQLLHAALAEAESRRSEQIAADIAASTRTQRLELSVATQQAELLSTRIEDVQSAQEKLSKDVASLRDMVEHPSESANAMSREVEHPTASMEKIMDERIAVLHERISEECNDRVEVLRKEMSSSRMEAIRAQVAEKLTASSISSTLAGDDDAMQHITHEVKKRLAEGVPSILAPQAPPTDVDAEDAAAAESGATRREMELLQHNVQANDVRLTARLEQLEEQLTQVEADQSEALNHLSIALRTHVESRVAEALAERPTPTAEEMEALATRVAEEVQRPLTKQVEDLHTSMDELRQRSEEHAAQEHVASLEVAVRGCEERCQQLSHDAMEAEERRATLAEELERLQGNLRHELSTLKDAPPPPPSDEKERCDRIEVALNAIMAKSDLPCPLNARVEELDDRLRHLGEDLRLVREESAHRQAELIPATSMDADSHQLSGRLAEVEVRMETMEEQSLAAAADTLATIHEIIRTCVHRFAAALQDSSSAPMTSSATPPPQTLDEVVLYLLNQLHMLGGGLQTLQRNAMATLELLEQQEMDTAVLVPLQQAVRHLSMVLQSAALRLELQPSDFDVDVGPTIASSSVAGSCLDDRLVESGVDE